MSQPTDISYLESIEDPFFKTVAQNVIPPVSDNSSPSKSSTMKSASNRLDDLEVSIRKQLLQLLVDHQQQVEEINNAENIVQIVGSFWKQALDLCHHLVYFSSSPNKDERYENMAARRLPILLISDCLDGLPSLEDSQQFWMDYVEPALDTILFQDLFWNDEKTVCHLPFLKVCNQFLKMLEYSSEDIVEWKGRILWDLSKGFSIADKSALKAWGSYRMGNPTEYEDESEFVDQSTSKLMEATSSSTLNPAEYSLYEAFWSLQGDFSNPNRIQVADFIKKLRLVLTALESAASNQSDTPTSLPRNSSMTSRKYLTSSALLPSQMANPDFRSSVVTQFLIIASHLSAESPPLKNALSTLLMRARKLLQNDSPQLYEVVWDGILASGRENYWRVWKKQKCLARAFAPVRKRANQHDDSEADLRESDVNKQKKMRLVDGPLGGNSGSREDSSTDDMYEFLSLDDIAKASQENRAKIPTLEQHLEPYVEALDPESGIEDEYHPKNDSLFTWRAMRLYTKHQLPLLSNCRQPSDLERITREWYKTQGREIPGEIPPETDWEKMFSDEENDGGAEQNGGKGSDIDAMGNNESQDDDQSLRNSPGSVVAMEHTNDDESINDRSEDSGKQSFGSQPQMQPADGVDNESDIETGDKVTEGDSRVESEDRLKMQDDFEKSDRHSDSEMKSVEEDDAPKIDDKTNEKVGNDHDTNSPEGKEEVPNPKLDEASNEKDDQDNQYEIGKVEKEQIDEPSASKTPELEKVGRSAGKPAPRDNSGPRGGGRGKPKTQFQGGGRRGDDVGTDRLGHYDDIPSGARRKRNDDVLQSRGHSAGRSGGELTLRGRSDGPPRGGGRHEDDYRGGSSATTGRPQGGGRGEFYAGDRGGVGRDDHRGVVQDRERVARDDHRSRDDYRSMDRSGGDSRRGNDSRSFRGSGGGRRDRRR